MTLPVRSPSLAANPRLGDWLSFHRAGEVEVRSGKVELGQGIGVALAQIVADGLGVDLAQVRMAPPTSDGPDESYTAGSLSVQHSGAALRQVCAEVRTLLCAEVASRIGRDATDLDVVSGRIGTPAGAVGYWDVVDERMLDRPVAGSPVPVAAVPRRHVGRSSPRPDLEPKILGRPAYIHDLRLPGQLHGRVVRPPSPGAVLVDLDEDDVRDGCAGAVVVRDGSFVGVVAGREDEAVRLAGRAARLARWEEAPTLPDADHLADFLLAAPATVEVLHRRTGGDGRSGTGAPGDGAPGDGAPGDRDRTGGARASGAAPALRARFSRPYLAHASIGPSCAVARWESAAGEPTLRVWSHSQGIHGLRNALADALDVPPADVVVAHVDGAGCYGHNGADDVALDAALLARAVPGRPVQVVWSRPDEMGWSPLAPAMVVDIEATRGADGTPATWRHHVWSNGHAGRPWSAGHPPLLAAQHRAAPAAPVVAGDPPMANGGGSGRNAVPGYDLADVEVVAHRLTTMPLRTSAMRALGAHLNVYAIEAVIDELAADAGADPVEYRLALLADRRARAVLEAAAGAAGWGGPLPPGTTGRGVGWARYKNAGAYCAVVAEVEAETEVRVTRLHVAADVGLAVNPDGARNQLEGGAIQAVSWSVVERIRFDRTAVVSRTWDEYPILTFSRTPAVDVVLVGATADNDPLGAGEASVGPTAAAIGNALAAALGVRVRDLPLTPAAVLAALDA